MKRKRCRNEKPCTICGKPTLMIAWSYTVNQRRVCDDCYEEFARRYDYDDDYMTEADYQTWGRL